jgi:hypothetical protein
MWCKEDAKSNLANLDETGNGVPEGWLDKLNQHRTAFDLLSDGQRFYQDGSIKNKERRPIADLLVEFPGADSLNHMRHVVHGSYGFCPACCVLGILRLSVWAPANAFYPASVNPASAAYAVVEGKNLFQAVVANLPETNAPTDQAPWLCETPPDPPNPVDKLAWRPRKLWLNVGSEHGKCANCDTSGVLIIDLFNEGGWQTPTTEGQKFAKAVEAEFKKLGYSAKGKDQESKNVKKVVKLASLIHQCRMDKLQEAYDRRDPQFAELTQSSEADAKKIARCFHQLISRNDKSSRKAIEALTKKPNAEEEKTLGGPAMRLKKFWDADPHLLKDGEPISLPNVEKNVALHSSKFWRDAVRLIPDQVRDVVVIGPVVNKFTFQDATSVALPDVTVRTKNRAALSSECSEKLHGLLTQVTPNPGRQHPEIRAAVAIMTPESEAKIRNRIGDTISNDKAFLHEVYAPVVEQVIASVTPGSPLRRYAAKTRAKALLNKKIRELLEKPKQQPTAETVSGKSGRGHRKGGQK